ncbi:MAG TPA: DUF2334 domain-containing protein [Solirubrobacteraceae bacterium]|nr:DUF2334 domain-containing protein [Solirubrobacteraceae bacterium]
MSALRGAPPAALARRPLTRPARVTGRRAALAVALHGVEPASFERAALMRDWLSDHGIERVTLLVVPARDLHPIGTRSPATVDWLLERRTAGDEIGQHGFRHLGVRTRALPRAGSQRAEFGRLSPEETRRAVHAGWRVMKLAGIEPEGFVAPAYAYTPGLRAALDGRYSWTADVMAVRGPRGDRGPLAPAWSLAPGRLAPLLAPALVRAGARLPFDALRLDLHPTDVEHPRLMAALERVLASAARERRAVTYGSLAGA